MSELKSALKKADTLYLATDEDREGEAIAWHLVQTLKPKVPVKRMVFHEITKEAIKASLDNTRDVDDDMVDAQETRRILDRLYGYELSPVLWRKVGPGLSAGRVQSVATRLIVERERERMAFVRAPYWDVTATLEAPDADGNNVAFESRMVSLGGRRLAGSKDFGADGKLTAAGAKDQVVQLDEAQASAIAQALEFATFTVASMETKPYRRRPVPPFTTSTLQQTAGNRLGMSSRQTMRAAQGLYENGYITYMRTDSVTLSQEAIAAAREASSSISAKTICRTRRNNMPQRRQARRKPTNASGRRARNSVTLRKSQAKCRRPAQAVHADLAAHACLPDGRRNRFHGDRATVRTDRIEWGSHVPGFRHCHRIPRLYEGDR